MMLVDFDEHELNKIRGDVSKHIITQPDNYYTIWDQIAGKIDKALGVVEVSDND
jgi:hypothetical protein